MGAATGSGPRAAFSRDSVRSAPHSLQNFAPGLTSRPQLGQARGNWAPHSSQNLARLELVNPQLAQRIGDLFSSPLSGKDIARSSDYCTVLAVVHARLVFATHPIIHCATTVKSKPTHSTAATSGSGEGER